MNLDEAKQRVSLLEYVRTNSEGELKRAGRVYWLNPCPLCKHYDHFAIDPDKNLFKSFSDRPECSGKEGSIIDYLMGVEGMEHKDAINKTLELAGAASVQRGKVEKLERKRTEEDIEKAASLIEAAQKKPCDFYNTRGLSEKTVTRFRLGFLPEGHPEYGKDYQYLIPLDDQAYTVRSSRNEQGKPKYLNSRGESALLNKGYIENPSLTDEIIYIAEGPLDALSLEELGYKAIALNSTSNKGKLIELMKNNSNKLKEKLFIVALDNDQAGSNASKEIVEQIAGLGLRITVFNLEGYKDINEALMADKQGLERRLKGFEEGMMLKGTVHEYLAAEFKRDQALRLKENKNKVATGFKHLDRCLGGSLYPGLFVLGAIPGVGKTAIALQIADNIAEIGKPVLFFSLEMSRNEMVCRSLTRMLYKKIKQVDKTQANAITTGHVLNSVDNNGEDISENKYFQEVVDEYGKGSAKNISMIQGGFDYGVDKVKETVREFISLTGKYPVVFIDYLQIMKPPADRMTEKQAVDFNTVELKRISRDFNIPVVVISSLNRTGYSSDVTFEAFKESGGIEYTADVVVGLQLPDLKVDKDSKGRIISSNIDKLMGDDIRKVQLNILKNRRGKAYEKINIDYLPAQNYFVESTD